LVQLILPWEFVGFSKPGTLGFGQLRKFFPRKKRWVLKENFMGFGILEPSKLD